jgi:hypothetical protein
MQHKPLLILVAGPYRSGTNDDPNRIAANVKAMTDTALELYRMGHLPVLGEWFALPLIEAAGSQQTGDEIFNALFHPVAIRLLDHVDAVLRIGGASAGADEMVRIGKEKGKVIFYNKAGIPPVQGL